VKVVLSIIFLLAAAVYVGNAFSRSRLRQLRQSGIYPPPGGGVDGDVRRLLSLGRKIDAIRLYREIHGGGLKSAKEAVERFAQEPYGFAPPNTKEPSRETKIPSRRKRE
jgi:hypothetical protein